MTAFFVASKRKAGGLGRLASRSVKIAIAVELSLVFSTTAAVQSLGHFFRVIL